MKISDIKFVTINGIVVPIKKTELEKESDRWRKRLTKEEKHAIRKYTKNSLEKQGIKSKNRFYNKLNRYLENKSENKVPYDENNEYYSKVISSGINKYSLKNKTVCYRKSRIDETYGLAVGKCYIQPSFCSTSISSTAFPDMGYTYTIFIPARTKCAYLGKVSRFRRQKELLLDKNTKFRVLSRKGKMIELEVVRWLIKKLKNYVP